MLSNGWCTTTTISTNFHWWLMQRLPCCSLQLPRWHLDDICPCWGSSLKTTNGSCDSQYKQGFMTGSWNITFHTSAYRWQPILIRDISSSMDHPLSAIPQCRVALSAMTHVPLGGKAKVLAHCCKVTIYCKGFPSSPVRAVIVQEGVLSSMPVEKRIEMKAEEMGWRW